MKRLIIFLFSLIISLPTAFGQHLQPAAIFQDGMVLQRGRPVHLWGRAKSGASVEARLLTRGEEMPPAEGENNRRERLETLARAECQAADDGTFSLHLPSLAAGGPYQLVLRSEGELRLLHNVWVGEVWLCSGQSNMALTVSEVGTKESDLAAADSLTRVHLYNMACAFTPYPGVWSAERADSVDHGLYYLPSRWQRCSRQAARSFSAIGFTFARAVADSLGCHVGIICNALGGSTAEGWIDSLTLQRDAPYMLTAPWTENDSIMPWARNRAKNNLQRVGVEKHRHPYAPAYLFHAATAPIAGYTLRGILWYQGESNAELPALHSRLFPLLQRSWRTAWGEEKLPFFTVQLSSIGTRPTWPAFRDSQRHLADELPHTYMAVCSDVGDSLDVHPRDKRTVGLRLAAQALYYAYGFENIVPSGPVPLRAWREASGNVCVRFGWADGLHLASGKVADWFELCGADGKWHPALSARIKGDKLTLATPLVTAPLAVRYAWRPFVRRGLENAQGLPCSIFCLEAEVNE